METFHFFENDLLNLRLNVCLSNTNMLTLKHACMYKHIVCITCTRKHVHAHTHKNTHTHNTHTIQGNLFICKHNIKSSHMEHLGEVQYHPGGIATGKCILNCLPNPFNSPNILIHKISVDSLVL